MSETPTKEEKDGFKELSEESVLVADPDDYAKTAQIKAIEDIKKKIREHRSDRSEKIIEYHGEFHVSGRDVYNRHLARLVAQYGTEMAPLIKRAEGESIDESDLVLEYGSDSIGIFQFIATDGYQVTSEEVDSTPERLSMDVYRRLLDLQRKMGLGADLEEQKGPAQI